MTLFSISKCLERLAPDRASCVSLLGFFCLAITLHAAEPTDPSAKIRDQLRAVTLQLRTAQVEAANANATAAIAEQKSKDVEKKVADLEKLNASLVKQANTDKAAGAESIGTLEKKVAAQDKLIGEFKIALEQWKTGYERAAAVANTKEDERAKLYSELTSAKLVIADRERKNIALFNTSNEILDRYEGYSLGKALAAREPFIGTTRVKVENLVQGYKDKILDNRIGSPATKR